MLKKAGIVLAATAAAFFSITPLAYAGDYSHDDKDHDKHKHHSKHHDAGDANVQRGLINVQDIGVQVPVQVCGNDLLSGVLGILSSDVKNKSNDEVDCSQKATVD